MDLKKLIETRVIAAFQPEVLRVIDESDQHIGHMAHAQGAKHFAIEIYSSSLTELKRVEAHRQIYALFTDVMPEPLHALKIILLKK
jgi:BolA family transcriptional regulator, general stress-responsive regulator